MEITKLFQNMRQLRQTTHRAFTLVELLVVIAIIGMLVGLLLPAVQTARESARKMSCSNNMRQIALGMLNYESARKSLPPAWTSSSCKQAAVNPGNYGNHNGLTLLLPYVEQQFVYDQFDLSKNWNSTSANSGTPTGGSNQEAGRQPISTFICPSSVGSSSSNRLFASDYAANWRLESSPLQTAVNAGFVTARSSSTVESALSGFDQTRRPRKLAEVLDGLSNSMLYFEDAGRPDYFKNRSRISSNSVDGAEWASSGSFYSTHYYPFQNANNNNETYSFHPGGCEYSFCDGSVHFLSDELDPETYVSLFSFNLGDLLKTSIE